MNKHIKIFFICLIISLCFPIQLYAQSGKSTNSGKNKISSVTLKYDQILYTGKALHQTEAITVKAKVNGKNKKLQQNIDYTASIYDVKKSGKAKLKIKGKGNYTGTIIKKIKIVKIPKEFTLFWVHNGEQRKLLKIKKDYLFYYEYMKYWGYHPILNESANDVSKFNGSFTNPVRKSRYSYTMKIKSVRHVPFSTYIKDGIKNYSINGGDLQDVQYTIYLPGTPKKKIPLSSYRLDYDDYLINNKFTTLFKDDYLKSNVVLICMKGNTEELFYGIVSK